MREHHTDEGVVMTLRKLLPSNRTNLEAALADAMELLADPNVIKTVSEVDNIPSAWIPWLAWGLSISDDEGWQFAESDEQKRELMRRTLDIHRHKGTIWSIREVFRILGIGEIDILENVGLLRYDGENSYNGVYIHGGGEGTWATYRVILRQAITNEQAVIVRRMLEGIAPMRSELYTLEYIATPIRYNGAAEFSGSYNFGSAT